MISEDQLLSRLRVTDRYQLRKKTRDPRYLPDLWKTFDTLTRTNQYSSNFISMTEPPLFKVMTYKEMRDYQNKNYASDLVNMGLEKAKQKEFTGAIELYINALELNPDCIEAKFATAEALVQQGLYTKAIEELEKILKDDPNNARAKAMIEDTLNSQDTISSIMETAKSFTFRPKDQVKQYIPKVQSKVYGTTDDYSLVFDEKIKKRKIKE